MSLHRQSGNLLELFPFTAFRITSEYNRPEKPLEPKKPEKPKKKEKEKGMPTGVEPNNPIVAMVSLIVLAILGLTTGVYKERN